MLCKTDFALAKFILLRRLILRINDYFFLIIKEFYILSFHPIFIFLVILVG